MYRYLTAGLFSFEAYSEKSREFVWSIDASSKVFVGSIDARAKFLYGQLMQEQSSCMVN